MPKNQIKNHLLTAIKEIAGALIAVLIIFAIAKAAPPLSPYNPGETLDPTCSSIDDENCTVTTPAISGANSDITSLSGLTTALSVGQGGTGLSTIASDKLLYTSTLDTLATLSLDSTLGISSGILSVQNNSISGAKLTLGSDTQGDIMYYNGTDWERLGVGTSGQYLKTQGTGTNPAWATLDNIPGNAIAGDALDWSHFDDAMTLDAATTIDMTAGDLNFDSGTLYIDNGVGTAFTTELVVGDRITVSAETKTVTAIASDTSLTVDTAFSDNTNDTSPDKLAAELIVKDSSDNIDFVVSDQGNVGIGTTAPNHKFDVEDIGNGHTINFQVTSDTNPSSGGQGLRLKRDSIGYPLELAFYNGDTYEGGLGLDYETDDFVVYYAPGVGDVVRFSSDGKGLIGPGVGTPGNHASLEIQQLGNDLALLVTGESSFTNGPAQFSGSGSIADAIKLYKGNTVDRKFVTWSQGNEASGTWRLGQLDYDNGFVLYEGGADPEDPGTARMFWEYNTGNVGIGTASPDRLLHTEVSDAATNTITYGQRISHITSGTAAAGIGTGIEFEQESASGNNETISAIQSILTDATDDAEHGELAFLTADIGDDGLAERMRIDENGSVGIGETTPTDELHVAGQIYTTTGLHIGADADANLFDDDSNGAGSTTMYIGNASIDVTASDVRLKENIIPSEINALELIEFMPVVDFDWKQGTKWYGRGRATGLVAQEMYEYFPQVVDKPLDPENIWSVEYHHLVPYLIKGIQELTDKNEFLTNRIEALEQMMCNNTPQPQSSNLSIPAEQGTDDSSSLEPVNPPTGEDETNGNNGTENGIDNDDDGATTESTAEEEEGTEDEETPPADYEEVADSTPVPN